MKVRPAGSIRAGILASALVGVAMLALWAAQTVPTDIKLPGTQQAEVATYMSPTNCDNCHYDAQTPVMLAYQWRGGMMANATRDPLFWATLAVAEQDFLPGSDPATRGGAGDLCLKCHSVNGWMAGRSTPTDGSGLSATADVDGVECEFCHLMVDPDPAVNIPGTTEVQNAPFQAYDPLPHPPGETYRGAAEYVMNAGNDRLGPYSNANAKHGVLASPFHRKADFCGTCHDVSNPVVGDLAPGNGTQVGMGLAPGTYSGVLGAPVDGKAAFNNAPYKYGIVERTFSEWNASGLDTLMVNSFGTLPADLKVTGGALEVAYSRAYSARSNANYEDGAARTFTCQTCHMGASTGLGCNKAGTPLRTDLPMHDQTGAAHWMPDAVLYMNTKGTLRLGGGLTQIQKDALAAGKARAQQMLQSAASLSAVQQDGNLVVRVTNLTGHKLLSGYPEGRRLWINVRWYDSGNNLVAENGAYGDIGRTAPDLAGVQMPVPSLLSPENTVVYEAGMGMDQAWAASLRELGYSAGLALSYNRLTDSPVHTLGELASSSPGTQLHTFHFVLNNAVVEDYRIPPYGFSYDEAKARNALPVPSTLFGNPGTGGTYNYWDERAFTIPGPAVSAEVRLYYQQTSWEYIQFLWKQNDGQSPFLGNEGRNLLDAWLHTGMAAPLQVASVAVGGLVALPPGEASNQSTPANHMTATLNTDGMSVDLAYTPACGATGHTVYYGPISAVASYAYVGSACSSDTSGRLTFTPPAGSVFFLVAAHNGAREGSYGSDSSGVPRPEASGAAFAPCDYPQDLTGSCDSP
jgi:hypothetical protein